MIRPPNTRLEGNVAVVTGAAHGTGRAICVELVREGARVWACAILGADLEETRRAVENQATGRAHTAVVDVSDPGQVNAFVARIADAEGRIDILVNTAGGVAGQTKRPVGQQPRPGWRRTFAIQLDRAFHLCRAGGPIMKGMAIARTRKNLLIDGRCESPN